jgi:hypothetical protein
MMVKKRKIILLNDYGNEILNVYENRKSKASELHANFKKIASGTLNITRTISKKQRASCNRRQEATPGWESNRSLVETINLVKKKEFNFKPGTRYMYNNSGYAILAFIIEKISGMSYGEFMKKNITGLISSKPNGDFKAKKKRNK